MLVLSFYWVIFLTICLIIKNHVCLIDSLEQRYISLMCRAKFELDLSSRSSLNSYSLESSILVLDSSETYHSMHERFRFFLIDRLVALDLSYWDSLAVWASEVPSSLVLIVFPSIRFWISFTSVASFLESSSLSFCDFSNLRYFYII